MYIEYFIVQGFKSLVDVHLDELSEVNIFHGLNNVGKSNILQAMSLYFQLLPLPLRLGRPESPLSVDKNDLSPYTETIFRQSDDPQKVTWQAGLRLPGVEQVVSLGLELTGELELQLFWPGPEPPEEAKEYLLTPICDFNMVNARRRLLPQWRSGSMAPLNFDADERHGPPIRPDNLRQALLDAAFGRDLKRRDRFRRLARLLDQHFENVGELDVALDDPRLLPDLRPGEPESFGQEILVRFLRSDLPEPILAEDAASGARQLLLLLSQLLLNPARIAGIEEPEMNLNPEWQARLLAVLRDLISPDPGGLDQVFITSHSPEFEAAEHFYDVTYADGETRVQKLPLSRRDRYFARLSQGEQMGPYLNSLNQVTLPRQVIDDLGLRRREPVFFYKAPDGHWRLRTKDEALALMEDREEYDGTADIDSLG